jgi:oligopeptidase B
MKTKASHRIADDEPDYTMCAGLQPEFDTASVRFVYQSMVTPSSTFEYDLNTRQQKLLKQQEVLGGYDPGSSKHAGSGRWRVHGHQGAISIVSKKGVKLDGKAPLLLTPTARTAHPWRRRSRRID